MEKEELINEKKRIEEEIRRVENRERNFALSDVARKLDEVSQALSNLQVSLNFAWKRTEQLKEEVRGLIR